MSRHHDMAQTAEKKLLTVSQSQSSSSIKASRRYPCKAQTLHINLQHRIKSPSSVERLKNKTCPPSLKMESNKNDKQQWFSIQPHMGLYTECDLNTMVVQWTPIAPCASHTFAFFKYPHQIYLSYAGVDLKKWKKTSYFLCCFIDSLDKLYCHWNWNLKP